MPQLAYHAAHEQHSPSELLRMVCLAEKAGFEAVHSSDHFYPWTCIGGQSGFSFSWLGAAMQATGLPFSVVCTPGRRLHPVVVAQAAATLGELFPGRFSIELGSGEALNEWVTGLWPPREERYRTYHKAARIIKKLLDGEEVTSRGDIITNKARLFTRPTVRPAVFGAALSEETADEINGWAEGLLTIAGEACSLSSRIQPYQQDGKPVFLQYGFVFGNEEGKAQEAAYKRWRNVFLKGNKLSELKTPEAFDKEGKSVGLSEFSRKVPLFTSVEALLDAIQEYCLPGVERIILHNFHPDQEPFLNAFRGRGKKMSFRAFKPNYPRGKAI